MKFKRLRSDGSYSSDHGTICAYSAPGHERKERFLRDAAALLRETGRLLARQGLTQSDVRINRAGMAVSGEASADYWNPNTMRGVWVGISTTCLSLLSGRKDGVSILSRWQTYKAKPAGRGKRRKRPAHQDEGPNQWLSPEFDAEQLAAALLEICDPQSSPSNPTAHTLSRGKIPIPSPVVSNQNEAETWFQGNQVVEAAFQADNDQATELVAVPVPLPLFDGADSPST
jgi:hypothetical protein